MSRAKGGEAPRITIEKAVPIPSRWRWPLDVMEVGDSILFYGSSAECMCLRRAACRFAEKTGRHFTVRKVADGQWRCWRID